MSEPTPTVRAQTLPLQGLANWVVRGLLRTPLLCRLVGKRLTTLRLAWASGARVALLTPR